MVSRFHRLPSGIIENKMETTVVYWGYIGRMEKKMETTIVYWGYIGIMENQMETTIVYWGTSFGFCLMFVACLCPPSWRVNVRTPEQDLPFSDWLVDKQPSMRERGCQVKGSLAPDPPRCKMEKKR